MNGWNGMDEMGLVPLLVGNHIIQVSATYNRQPRPLIFFLFFYKKKRKRKNKKEVEKEKKKKFQ